MSENQLFICGAFLFLNASTYCAQGLTFTAATHIVFAELYWDPGHIKQAEDRAHRIGQCSSVNIHFLIAKGTMDTFMWAMLNRKVGVQGPGEHSSLCLALHPVPQESCLSGALPRTDSYTYNCYSAKCPCLFSFGLFWLSALRSRCKDDECLPRGVGWFISTGDGYFLALYCCCCSVYNCKAFMHFAYS